MTVPLGLLLIAILALSCLSTSIFEGRNNEALAQQYIQTIKYRNLVIDLGKGVKTNAQLTYSGPEGRMKIRSTLDALFDSAFLQGAHIFPLNRY